MNKITSIASASVLAVSLLGVAMGPAISDALVPPLSGEHRQNAWEAFTAPETTMTYASPVVSISTPEEGDTNTHVLRDSKGKVTAVVPDSPKHAAKAPRYTIDSIARPSEREWADLTVALVHDPKTNVSIVYPATLPACDSDDGTAVSNHKLVAACKWDGGKNSFIVIAP